MDKEGQAAAAASGSPGPAILKALEDMLITLRKSSKDLAFYPPGHPRLNRSLEQAAEELHTVMAAHAPLTLAVSRIGFTFNGQPVGKENRQLAAMAAELFVRRIQKIFFARDVGPEELAGFLRVITSDPKQLVQQGGSAKVLAAHGVGRIQVNEFEFRRVGTAAGRPAEGAVVSPPGSATSPDAGVASEVLPGDQEAGLQGEVGTPTSGAAPGQGVPAAATGGEQARQDPVTPESLLASPKELTVEALIQRLEQEATSGGAAGYEWAASRLEKAAVQAVHDDRLQDVLAILRVFLRHQRADALKASLRERAARAAETIADDNTVSYLVEHLRTEAGESIEGLSDVLVDLGAPVIPRILDRLTTENQDAARLWIVATLARLHEAVEGDLARALQTLERDQACHLASILGEIGGETGLVLLTCLFRHRDPRVRSEAVREQGRFEEPAAQRLLMQALRDPDPAVIEVAVGLVGAAKLKLATPTLLRLAGQRALTGKPFAVRKAALTALGAVGDPGMVRILGGLLYTRTWFQRAAGDELRQAAAQALLAMGGPEAREVVEAGARSRRRDVRRACTAALRVTPAAQ